MRFPSLDRLAEGAFRAARRFPLALLSGVAAAVAGWWLVGAEGRDAGPLPERLLYVATLGLPAFIAARLFAERRGWTGLRGLLPSAAAAGLLGVVFLLRPGWADPVAAARYVQISVVLHLLVAVGPYVGSGGDNGFWQYNRTLLLRFLIGFLFAVVLFGGLSVALLAVDRLLGIEVQEETYGRLWFLVAFVFHPWYFLGGVPGDLPALERDTDYPPVLKVFGQYVLAPIVTLYLVILTIYLVRILVTRVWPSGWIGWLVTSVAAAGILSLLILHPVREREENRWVATYARWFFVALLPSVAMLLMAIWKRIDQYGVTERRYFLVVLAVWLAAISVRFILRRRTSVRAIPATLCAVALLTLFGPWGAYAVSERSQTGRLRALLVTHDLPGGAIPGSSTGEIPFEDRREISAVVRYLVETGRTSELRAWLGDEFPENEVVPGTGGARRGAHEQSAAVTEALGVEYVTARPMLRPAGEFDLFAAPRESGLRVEGYDWIFRDRGRLPDTLVVGERRLEVALDSARATLVVREKGSSIIEIPLATAIERALSWEGELTDRGRLPQEALLAEAENERIRIAAIPAAISGRLADPPDGDVAVAAPPVILSLRTDYLVRLNP